MGGRWVVGSLQLGRGVYFRGSGSQGLGSGFAGFWWLRMPASRVRGEEEFNHVFQDLGPGFKEGWLPWRLRLQSLFFLGGFWVLGVLNLLWGCLLPSPIA